ncbi:MAG: cytochrome-c peroxidase [Pseudohongiellaceae bacterium]
MIKKLLFITVALAITSVAIWHYVPLPANGSWSQEELKTIKSFSLSQLGPMPVDPSNQFADMEEIAEFGHFLFFDRRLSGDDTIACASCHKPELSFTDGLELAVGTALGPRHTPSLLGVSHSPWFYWDGRKDSQWSQALAPLEASHEHNTDRTSIAALISSDLQYKTLYENLFATTLNPPLFQQASPLGNEQLANNWEDLEPEVQNSINQIFVNVGKALAAYQRKILPGRTRLDDYADSLSAAGNVEGESALSSAEIAGLRLFMGKAQCVTCHNGPLFTNHEFHNTGVMAISGELPPMARYDGIRTARQDPFNCLGKYSDAKPSECIELRFARDDNELVGAQKTPTLRNITETAPYMHGGQIKNLIDVVKHYNQAPTSMLSHNEAKPLGLRPVEERQLEAFLRTLSAPLSTAPHWLKPPE